MDAVIASDPKPVSMETSTLIGRVVADFIVDQSIATANNHGRMLNDIENLIGTLIDASEPNPLLNLPSIFGPVSTWFSPLARNQYSEFKILDLWRLGRAVKYLFNTLIPSIPVDPPPFGPPLLNNIFWRPTVILQRPDHNGSYTSFLGESWFFINGIMTNDSVAQLNAAYLANLFHRPITLIQNSTDSCWIDLFECLLGRDWEFEEVFNKWDMTEPVVKAFPPIYEALTNPHKTKVVVIAHSQGTIIMDYVLRLLKDQWPAKSKQVKLLHPKQSRIVAVEPEQAYTPATPVFVYPNQAPLKQSNFRPVTPQELAKLEIYCFANCAKSMTYADPETRIPWIESYGNKHDYVARLGMLAPHLIPDPIKTQAVDTLHDITIDGLRYLHKRTWGHFLNAHYLYYIDKYERRDSRKPGGRGDGSFNRALKLLNQDPFSQGRTPRLFNYLNGGHLSSPPKIGIW